MLENLLTYAPAVRVALDRDAPVVALESTVIAHGLPWPHNLELARDMERVVREGGAVAATIGVLGGVPTIGIDEAAVRRFADSSDVLKLSRRDLAYAVANGRDGATTVAATMALAQLAGIEVFATGGIGGVHRGARDSWDVSADLTELGRTPVLVVCAGAKSILDLPATLEVLETAGVPVVGYGSGEFPAFFTRTSGLPVTARADSPAEVAALWQAHRALGGGSGMLLAVPPPADDALAEDEVEQAIAVALGEAERQHIRGNAVTPFLLKSLVQQSGGRTLRTNIALLLNNATVAAQVAVAIGGRNKVPG